MGKPFEGTRTADARKLAKRIVLEKPCQRHPAWNQRVIAEFLHPVCSVVPLPNSPWVYNPARETRRTLHLDMLEIPSSVPLCRSPKVPIRFADF